jgi:excisionase family DNA binding protein
MIGYMIPTTMASVVVPVASDRPTLTVPEAGRIFGLSRPSAYAAAARGEIPTIKMGRRLLVPTGKLRVMLGLPVDEPIAS